MSTAKSVLIVDDIDSIRHLIETILRLEGYLVFSAGNGAEALQVLAESASPGLIILDMMMPVMDGAEFLRRRRLDERLRKIPVVVVTAFEGDPGEADIEMTIKKPMDTDTLINVVKRYCGPGRLGEVEVLTADGP